MDPAAVAWGWPLGVLAAGLALGGLLVWRMRRAPAGPAAAGALPLELRDLDGRLDALVLQLRELQDLAAKRSPEQLARERYAMEVQAAEVLREREQRAGALASAKKVTAASAPPAPTVPAGFLATRPALRGFLWGTATAASLALLVLFVGRTARPREEGGGLTGSLPSPGAPPPAEGEMEAELRAVLEKNPDDFDARLDVAQLRLRQRDLMGVWNETQYVLAKQPGHPRALSYQALVRLAMGQPDVAVRTLKEALARDPNLFEAYLHLALVQTRAGHAQEAQAAIDEASRRFPERAEVLARALSEIRASGTQERPAVAEEDPHARVPPPGGSVQSEGTSSGPGGQDLTGVIELPAALASRLRPDAIVFVTVREARATEGPPVAAKRLAASSFPLRFAIGPEDSMMGQPFPARARVEARVDSDGDPLTRDASDPSARLDDVAAGSSRLRLVLR